MIVCEVREGLQVLMATLVMGCVSARPAKLMDEALELMHVPELGKSPLLFSRNGNTPPLEPVCMAEACWVTWPKQGLVLLPCTSLQHDAQACKPAA